MSSDCKIHTNAEDANFDRCSICAHDRIRELEADLNEAHRDIARASRRGLLARIRYLESREAEAWALLTDVRFCGRNGLHSDIDKWLAAYPAERGARQVRPV